MNTQTVYDVDYFLDKFEKIPEERWVEGAVGWAGLGANGSYCAGGHCGFNGLNQTPESSALTELLRPLVSSDMEDHIIIYWVNDGSHVKYRQRTPKKRILAALRDIKKIQESSQVVSKEPDVQECDATEDESSNGAWPNKTKSFTNLIPVVSEVQDLIKQSVTN